MTDTGPETPEGSSPPMAHGGLFVNPNWTPRLTDRLGSVRTDNLVHEHWPRDLAPVFYPHVPNAFWLPVPLATSADAGTPGDFQPSGAGTPETIEDMATVTANPLTPWSSGQYMLLNDEVTEVYWNGGAWAPGRAPDTEPPIVITVTGTSPATGSEAGGDGVTVTGTGFIGVDPTTGVMFGPNAATGFIPGTPAQFTCLTPPGTGTVDVSVTGDLGTASLAGAFTYVPDASQTAVEPPGTGEALPQASPGPEASNDPTEVPAEAEEEVMTEYEMDQYWGITPEEGEPEA